MNNTNAILAEREAEILVKNYGHNAGQMAAMYQVISRNTNYWHYVQCAIQGIRNKTIKA